MALSVRDGGMAFGNNPGTPGPFGAALGLTLLALAGAVALTVSRGRIDGPGRLLAALAGAWAALNLASMTWAADPALAWLAANRALMLALAIAAGIALAVCAGDAARRALAPAVTLAALPALTLALASEAVPTVWGEDGVPARLSFPVGHPNVLALVAAMALPGAIIGVRRPGPWDRLALAAGTGALVCAPLTLSRGGLVAVAVGALLTLASARCPRAAVARLVVMALAAAPPVVLAMTADSLATDSLPAAERRSMGAVFGLLLVAGAAFAAWAGPRCARRAAGMRVPVSGRMMRRGTVIAAAAVAVLPLMLMLAGPEVRDCKQTAVGDADAARVASLDANQRGPWWCEAGRGWKAAPVVGNGAGSFPVVERRWRATGNSLLQTRDPHGLWPETASAMGTVGIALMVGLWGMAGWALWTRRRRLPAGLAAIPAAAFAQAQTDWVFSWPVVFVPVGVAIGLMVADRVPRGRRRGGGEAVAAALTAAACLAVVASAWLPYLSERAQLEGENALYLQQDPAAAYRGADRAAAYNPVALAPLLLKADAFEANDQRDAARAQLVDATRRAPDNPDSWGALARAATRWGERGLARRAWDQVARLDPLNSDLAAYRATQGG